MTSKELAKIAYNALDEKKGINISVIDISQISVIADYFIIAGGNNENQVKALAEKGEPPANIARFALEAVCGVVLRATQEAQRQYPGLPVLCSGGVASNTQLRAKLTTQCGALFAKPEFSTDNAMGTAILTWRALAAEGR